jgi:hypothetical protein
MKKKLGLTIFCLTLILSMVILSFIYSQQHKYFYVSQRETQTAISSYYIKNQQSGLFDYITPIVGYPWAVPLEFPIYQYITAKTSGIFLPLNDNGRVISFLFFLVSLFMAFKILRILKLSLNQAYLFLALFVSSPIYLSYSLTFTIETTALFFAILYLYLFLLYLEERKLIILILVVCSGMLAALTKITTWVATVAVICFVTAYISLRKLRKKEPFIKELLPQLMIIIIPLISGHLWTVYTDGIKMKNPLGAQITSSALSAWNFGTLEQKLSLGQWLYFLGRSLTGIFGVIGLLIPFILLYVYIKKKQRQVLDKKLLYLSLVVFFCGPIIFTNLYFQHDYYIIAGGIYLIFFIFLMFKDSMKTLFFIALIISNLVTAFLYLQLKQINYYNPQNQQIVQSIKSVPDQYTMIVFGASYDSFIPYYSQKKAMQTILRDFSNKTFQRALENMKDKNVGFIVVKSKLYEAIASSTAAELSLTSRFVMNERISFYYKEELSSYLKFEKKSTAALADKSIEKFLGQFNSTGNRILINFNRQNLISIMYYFNGNFYMFDLKNGFQILDYKRYGFPGKEIKLTVEDKESAKNPKKLKDEH